MAIRIIGQLKRGFCFGLLALLLAGCSQASEPEPQQERIASTAKMTIIEPAQGAVITGNKLRVRIALEGGEIIPQATQDIKPDEGHVHLSLDGKLSTMTYGLDQEIDVTPGPHILQVEFVAGDHAPFQPRVIQARRIQVQ